MSVSWSPGSEKMWDIIGFIIGGLSQYKRFSVRVACPLMPEQLPT